MKKQISSFFLAALILAQAPAFAAIGSTATTQTGISVTIPAHYKASLKNGTLCIEPKMHEEYRIMSGENLIAPEECENGGTKISGWDKDTDTVSIRIEPE
ncbi:MAG: hypothetical protein K8R48_05495 [Alphaproteobacteria bacterium]|nr:hypothetical protein [Alphaproteobacteria bacterium]